MSTATSGTAETTFGIDPRGPRFGAAITSVLLLIVVLLGLTEPIGATFVDRALQPSALVLTVLVALFAWGAFAGIQKHPYGALYRALVARRLGPPAEREHPAPPTFAQLVGLIVTATGLMLHLVGLPGALVVAASAAFIAAFLNAVFAYCLGCQLYVLFVRAKVIRRSSTPA
ncbi:MAG: DUF4395 domain-containing protein [Microcella sp.]|nr:DUF4395 domain-containing protein [Microcella sp.]